MTTIHKYKLNIESMACINMPAGAEILKVGLDPYSVPSIWALVDTDEDKVPRVFSVIGTGHPAAFSKEQFVGSFLQGPFVWHVFEVLS